MLNDCGCPLSASHQGFWSWPMSGILFESTLADAVNKFDADLRNELHLPVTGFSFAELMVMGLIRANPIKGGPPDKQRLANAMRALFGTTRRLRSDVKDDARALSLMAQW